MGGGVVRRVWKRLQGGTCCSRNGSFDYYGRTYPFRSLKPPACLHLKLARHCSSPFITSARVAGDGETLHSDDIFLAAKHQRVCLVLWVIRVGN